jgi:hypothetical protein
MAIRSSSNSVGSSSVDGPLHNRLENLIDMGKARNVREKIREIHRLRAGRRIEGMKRH